MMYDLLPVICWYLCDAWQDVRSVTCDLLGKMYDLLPGMCCGRHDRCTICCP